MRRRGAHGRLTSADRLEVRLRIAAGERYEAVAAAVGCSTKSVQRLLATPTAHDPYPVLFGIGSFRFGG